MRTVFPSIILLQAEYFCVLLQHNCVKSFLCFAGIKSGHHPSSCAWNLVMICWSSLCGGSTEVERADRGGEEKSKIVSCRLQLYMNPCLFLHESDCINYVQSNSIVITIYQYSMVDLIILVIRTIVFGNPIAIQQTEWCQLLYFGFIN